MAPGWPLHIRVQRAKAFIKDGIEVWLKVCAKSGAEFYGVTKDSKCGECESKKKGA
jgi:hypothetical protein